VWVARLVQSSLAAATVGTAISSLSALAPLVGPLGDLFAAINEFGADIQVDFYRQVSQIIPVLLLALAIERRVFEASDLSSSASPTRVARTGAAATALIAVVVAELLSLYAVASGEAEAFFFPVTAGAVVMLLIMIVVVALGAFRTQLPSGGGS
jgi:hypothetical protein